MPAEQYREYVRLAKKMLRDFNMAPASQKRRVAQALVDAVVELQAAQERFDKLLRYADHDERCKQYRHDFHLRLPTADPIPCLCGFVSAAQHTEEPSERHKVSSPFYNEDRGRWQVECSCGWETEEKTDGAAKYAGKEHLNDPYEEPSDDN